MKGSTGASVWNVVRKGETLRNTAIKKWILAMMRGSLAAASMVSNEEVPGFGRSFLVTASTY